LIFILNIKKKKKKLKAKIKERKKMGKILGIDLGTTFSVMATADDAGNLKVIENDDGDNLTASCVEIDGKNIEVGKIPSKYLGVKDTVVGRWKREMGTDKTYEIAGKKYTPSKLSSFVLKKLYTDAKNRLGNISEIVVTIPANFTDEARKDTMNAAELAGFKVDHIINEPTAAAFYYAYNKGLNDGTYAIIDLGGGTFDVSIIKIDNKDVEVLTSEGVQKLGGDDFDKALIKLAQEKYKKDTNKDLATKDYTLFNAEDDKKTLSKKESVALQISAPDAQIKVTREEYETAISKYLAQIEMTCEAALNSSKLKVKDIEGVILAGGSTRTPAIKKIAKDFFKNEPISTSNPDTVIALGAAFYALYKTDPSKLNAAQRDVLEEVELTEVLNHNYGTIVETSLDYSKSKQENSIILKKNSKIPIKKTSSYYTIVANQTILECDLTECKQEEKDPKWVKILGTTELSLPREGHRPAGMEVKFTYHVNDSGMLHCRFEDVESGKSKDATYQLYGNKNETIADDDIDDFKIE